LLLFASYKLLSNTGRGLELVRMSGKRENRYTHIFIDAVLKCTCILTSVEPCGVGAGGVNPSCPGIIKGRPVGVAVGGVLEEGRRPRALKDAIRGFSDAMGVADGCGVLAG
jgi:hypothetical protein